METLIHNLLTSFIITFVSELIIVKLFLRKQKVFSNVLLANIITNPIIVFSIYFLDDVLSEYKYPRYGNSPIYNIIMIGSVIILELIAVCVEAKIYFGVQDNITKEKSIIISVIANIVSFFAPILFIFLRYIF